MLSALGFLTVLGGSCVPDRRTLAAFPIVGAGIGALLAAILTGGRELWSAPMVAAVVLTADLVITGALHLDGLADSADGLLPHLERARRLEVMSAPDTGALALGAVTAVLLLRWSALTQLTAEPTALIGIWAASRTVMATIPALVPYARAEGLASALLGGASRATALWLLPIGAGLAAVDGWHGAAALGALLAGSATVTTLARRRIGGFTGDVLGAAGIVGETLALVALVTAR